MTNLITIISILYSLLFPCFAAWILTQIIFGLLKQLHVWNPRKLPPGPFPLPIIGNLHCLGKMPHKSLAEIARRYGDLVSLQLGSLTTVVVSSPSRAEELFRQHDATLAYRQIRQTQTINNQHLHSVVFSPPDHRWRFLRKIGTSQLFANSRLDSSEELRRKKVQELISYVKECCQTSTAVNISQAVFSTSLNILSNTFFSMDICDLRSSSSSSVSDPGHEFKLLFTVVTALSGIPNIADFFPLLGPIDPQGIRRRSKVTKERIMAVFDRLIKQRMCSRKENIHSSRDDDVLDVLLNIHEENPEFGLVNVRFFLLDMFLAGTETTSSTIEWAMAELISNPDKMTKAQAELDQVIGKGNLINDRDIPKLPYLRAVIKETLRLHPPVPFLIPRKASAHVKLNGGFMIPKHAQVWINVWAIGRDERVWKDAQSFQPERFSSSPAEIDYRGQNFNLIPFGSGRRVCLGLTFAHRVLHTNLGSLINCYDWKFPEGEEGMLDMEERFGITLMKARPLCVIPVHGS